MSPFVRRHDICRKPIRENQVTYTLDRLKPSHWIVDTSRSQYNTVQYSTIIAVQYPHSSQESRGGLNRMSAASSLAAGFVFLVSPLPRAPVTLCQLMKGGPIHIQFVQFASKCQLLRHSGVFMISEHNRACLD